MSKKHWTIFVGVLTLLMSLSLHADEDVTATSKSGYTQNISVGLTDIGFDLGYEQEIFPKQSLRFEAFSYPTVNSNYVDNSIFGMGADWFYYFNPHRTLSGWFMGPSIRLWDQHTNYPSDELIFIGGILGGYQFVFFRHVVFSAGYGPAYGKQRNDPIPNVTWDSGFSGGRFFNDLEFNIGWAF